MLACAAAQFVDDMANRDNGRCQRLGFIPVVLHHSPLCYCLPVRSRCSFMLLSSNEISLLLLPLSAATALFLLAVEVPVQHLHRAPPCHPIAIAASFFLSASGGLAASVPFLWNLRFGLLSAFRSNSRRFKKAAIEFYAEGPSCTHVPRCRWYRCGITTILWPHCRCAVRTPIVHRVFRGTLPHFSSCRSNSVIQLPLLQCW
jgi:hypothetical protein